MYLENNEKSACYGCTACFSVCPTKCIEMERDIEGFLYPKTDFDKCIHCNACIKACPYDKETSLILNKLDHPDIFGAKHIDDSVKLMSSSGGIFTGIVKHVIKHGGIVYGAVFNNETLIVEHVKADDLESAYKMRGSKYVQSNLHSIFLDIEKVLKTGKLVCFSGSPCQVAGLLQFLKKDYKNLITVDFICHGVPSPRVFSDYIKFVSKEEKIKSVEFRNKEISWHVASMKLKFSNGKTYMKKWTRDPFYALFFKDLILRPSCYECKYSKIPRTADITMGDFWGIEKSHAAFNDPLGVSYLLINTEKGAQLFTEIKEQYEHINARIEDARQPNLKVPTPKPFLRNIFWVDYEKFEFVKIIKKYADYGILSRTKLYSKYGYKIIIRKIKTSLNRYIKK